jgi:acetyltransferase-like isoleucine patch superfamily enzyme
MKRCNQTKSPFLPLVLRLIYYRLFYNQTFFVHPMVKLYGVKNIQTVNKLTIGINHSGHSHPSDSTVINVEGKLSFAGNYSIGRGCRIYIGKKAEVRIGKDGFLNSNTQLNISNELLIGNNTVIGWNCQFLDSDLHKLVYSGKRETKMSINIGHNVWIGCNVHIYKGANIPDNCVIAADSIVRGHFDESHCLIGGNPAKILRKNINWHL